MSGRSCRSASATAARSRRYARPGTASVRVKTPASASGARNGSAVSPPTTTARTCTSCPRPRNPRPNIWTTVSRPPNAAGATKCTITMCRSGASPESTPPRRAGARVAPHESSSPKDDHGGRESRLMGQADVGVAHAAPARPLGERAGEPELGSTPRVRHDFHLSEPALENPGAERLETCFLGGEARGERLSPVAAVRAGGQLTRGEHPILELTGGRQRARQPFRFDDVDPDADDHAVLIRTLDARV